ncbi:MAG TPA: ribosome maturation factor RimM [Anaerolineales bacterium]
MMRPGADSTPINTAGSQIPGEPAFLAVGKLRHAHGVHGEMLMEVWTDFPDRLQHGVVLYLDSGAAQLHLTKCRKHNQGLLLSFEGYTTPEMVSQFRNQVLYVKSEDRPPLADGEYYHHQLIGLTVLSDDGASLGLVTNILETGASDVLVVHPAEGADILIPMVDAFIRSVDLARREITVHLISGMLAEVD